jgi:hypothetical protein
MTICFAYCFIILIISYQHPISPAIIHSAKIMGLGWTLSESSFSFHPIPLQRNFGHLSSPLAYLSFAKIRFVINLFIL